MELLRDGKFAESPAGIGLLTDLAHIVGSRNHGPEVSKVIVAVAEHNGSTHAQNVQNSVILGLGKGLKQFGSALPEPGRLTPSGAKLISSLMSRAESTALNRTARSSDRLQSIQLIGCLEFQRAQSTLRELLDHSQPKEVQLATLDILAEYNDPTIALWIIAGWNGYLPAVRTRAIRLLLSRDEWALAYLTAVEKKQASVAEIEPTGRAQLLEHRKDSIRLTAKKLFSNSPRDSVIASYRSVLERPGDPSRGELVYKRECSGCHHVRDTGYEVGPDLTSSPSRNPEALLINILDPNRTVDPAFLQYLIVDKSGRTFSGKIVSETANSITLTSGKGIQDIVLRSNIDEIISSGKSLMPEGFEKTISKEEMANVIAFLNGLESTPGAKQTQLLGTRPGTVEP
jgi:putative heme-binding domain-containing protein